MFMPSGAAAAQSQPLAVSVTPDTVEGSAAAFPITTTTCSSIVSGGSPPYTYLWERVGSPDPGASTEAESPTASATRFRANGFVGGFLFETWQVTVTDAASRSESASVTVTWTKT